MSAIEEQLAAAKYMVVETDGTFVGLLIPADIILHPHMLVGDCVSPKPNVATDDTIEATVALMEKHSLLVLPVFKDACFYGIIRYQDILQSIYEEKRSLEAQMSKMEKLDSLCFFTTGVAHDLNNILHISIGNLDLALDAPEISNEPREQILAARQVLMNARQLVSQLYSISDMNENAREILDITEVVRKTVSAYVRRCSIQVRLDFEKDIPKIPGNLSQIVQLTTNLIVNAVQSMPGGGVLAITCDTRVQHSNIPLSATANYVHIAFSDTGTGIDAASLSRIFEPYFTTKEAGTGLGLAIVCSIVKKHHGFIEVSSKLNVGTTFDVYLPVANPGER